MFSGVFCIAYEAKSHILCQFFCIPTKIPVLFPLDQKSFPKGFSFLQTLVSPWSAIYNKQSVSLACRWDPRFVKLLNDYNELVDYCKRRGYHIKPVI